MRLYVGGVEKTYPARWFFCDPQATHFPSPHGAEASPWLKQYEVNKDWGDDGTLKKLDRGINPGYPGNCFVGEPSWFIDGQLPQLDFSKCQPPPVPCCGHVVPHNSDPRCPPSCGFLPCDGVAGGFMANAYTVTLANGTGDFAAANGSTAVLNFPFGNCVLITPGLPNLEANVSFNNRLTRVGVGFAQGTPHFAAATYSFTGPIPIDALGPVTDWSAVVNAGVGNPWTIILAPLMS